MDEFLRRLKRRKLVQWALAYVAAAFALIQVLDIVIQRFGGSESLVRILIVALAIGFFVALVLAWYHGERGAQRASGTELMILALLLTIGGALLWRLAQGTGGSAPAATSASTRSKPASTDKSIAVLPFENMSADKDNAYFAAGMRDEILTRLAGIRDLKVISRTSTEHYASHPEDIRSVGEQLGVATVLEGSVQKAGGSAHINVQLIDVHNDAHLWADSYDRDLSNIFVVERDVAQKVADALQARLLPDEAARVASVPTQDSQAYDLYLRGLAHFNRADDEYGLTIVEMPQAIAAFERALDRDPKFARAAAALSEAHMYMYWFAPDRTEQRLALAKTMSDRALALQPDLGRAFYSRGLVMYWGARDYAGAQAQFEQARRLLPNDPDVELTDAAVWRRQGQLDKAIAGFERAAELNPHSGAPFFNLAQCYLMRRQYSEAEKLFTRAAEASADPDIMVTRRAEAVAIDRGDLAPLQSAVAAIKPATANYTAAALRSYLLQWWRHDFAAAARVAQDDSAASWADQSNVALPRRLYVAWGLAAGGDKTAAHALYVELEPLVKAAVDERPTDSDRRLALAFVYAGLARKDAAIEQARKAVQLTPVERDAFSGPGYLVWQARLYASVGARDEAIATIQRLSELDAGHVLSPALLRMDPFWDALRADPRLSKLEQDPAAQVHAPGGQP